MSTGSRIGKTHTTDDFLKLFPDSKILVEAAIRRGQSMNTLIKPISPNTARVDLQKWKNAYLAATNTEFPNRNLMYDVFKNIEIDLMLTANTATRIFKVQQSKFILKDKSGKEDVEARKFLEKSWFNDFIKEALDTKFWGPCLLELFDFTPEGELAKVSIIDRYHIKPELSIVTREQNDTKGTSYIDGPISQYYMLIGDPKDLGLLYKIAPSILAKKYALGTWSEFNEKIGIPFRTVHSSVADSSRQEQLAIIMEEMGSAGWAVLNENEKVELLQINGSDPTKCFDGLIKLLDNQVATAILGQNATSNSSDNKGTYGSMQVLQQVTDLWHQADLTFIKYLVNDYLIPRLKLFGYKIDHTFDWDKSIDMSVSETVDYVVKLSSIYTIDPKYVTEKTGIPIIGLKNSLSPTIPKAVAIKKKNLTVSIPDFYKQNKCCSSITAKLISKDFEPDMLRIAKALFENKHNGVTDIPLMKKTANELLNALNTGYTTNVDDKDVEMIKSLKQNIYVFSGFKTEKTLREISSQLIDEKGNVRSFNDFKNEALKINQTYNVNYLNAEYNHAIVSSQMASQWQDIQRNKDVLPYLEFDATNDQRTTDICASLDGTLLPVDDEFWNTYYLPLHWNERSIIRQRASGKVTDKETIAAPELKPMFKANVGKDGVIFPESHPYYNVLNKARKNEIITVSQKQEIYSRSRAEQFEIIFTNKKTGATVSKHILTEITNSDYKNNLAFCKALSKDNISTELMPIIDAKEVDVRKIIYPQLNTFSTNPDIMTLQGNYIDVKGVKSVSKIVKRANEASKQGAIVCITDENIELTEDVIKNKTDGIFANPLYKFNTIYFFKNGKIITKIRKTI